MMTQTAQKPEAMILFAEKLTLPESEYSVITCPPKDVVCEEGWVHFSFRDRRLSVPVHKVSCIMWPPGFQHLATNPYAIPRSP